MQGHEKQSDPAMKAVAASGHRYLQACLASGEAQAWPAFQWPKF